MAYNSTKREFKLLPGGGQGGGGTGECCPCDWTPESDISLVDGTKAKSVMQIDLPDEIIREKKIGLITYELVLTPFKHHLKYTRNGLIGGREGWEADTAAIKGLITARRKGTGASANATGITAELFVIYKDDRTEFEDYGPVTSTNLKFDATSITTR